MAINYFNIFMVIMNKRLLLYRAYLFHSKHILSISSVVKNFSNISCARYAFQRKGVSRSSYQELCAHPFYPSFFQFWNKKFHHPSLKNTLWSWIPTWNTKLYNLKTFGVMYQVHIKQALQQDYIKQLNEDTVYHSIARTINSLLKYVYMLLFCCWRNTTGFFWQGNIFCWKSSAGNLAQMVGVFTQPGPWVCLFIDFKNDRPKPNLPKRKGIHPLRCSVWVC